MSSTPMDTNSSPPTNTANTHITPSSSSSSGPQIRSRITVVCAECKRLKLKCDRRNPCGSCVKRDTVVRCIYSPAAAEKVDLHSLNNRLQVVEAQLVLLSSCPLPSSSTFSTSSSLNSIFTTPSKPPLPGSSSSIHISPQELGSAWLDNANININGGVIHEGEGGGLASLSSPLFASPLGYGCVPSHSSLVVKPDPDALPSSISSSSSASIPLASVTTSESVSPTPSFILRHLQNNDPLFTAAGKVYPARDVERLKERAGKMVRWAEKESTTGTTRKENAAGPRAGLFGADGDHSFEFNHEPDSEDSEKPSPASLARVLAVLALGALVRATDALSPSESGSGAGSNPPSEFNVEEEDEVCMLVDGGAAPPRRRSEGGLALGSGKAAGTPRARAGTNAGVGARSGASAKGGKEKDREKKGKDKREKAPSKEKDSTSSVAPVEEASKMLGLARLALDAAEPGDWRVEGKRDGVEWVRAAGGVVLCGVYEAGLAGGSASKGMEKVFMLVGKLVNAARMLGLGSDPSSSDSGGKVQREERRRAWWDVVWWDLFISDALGHAPLIAEGSFTTKLPSSSSPSGGGDEADAESVDAGPEYFIVKCRLAQLVRRVKAATADVHRKPLTLDQAAMLEGEVGTWLADLPMRFRLEGEADDAAAPVPTDTSADPLLTAQRCELAITAHRLVLKLYLPFLLSLSPSSSPAHQAAGGTLNASHALIHAIRKLPVSYWPHVLCAPARVTRDASVVCACAARAGAPKTVWARTAGEDARAGLEMMMTLGRGAEGVREIVEGLLEGEKACAGTMGVKRKRDEAAEDADADALLGVVSPVEHASAKHVMPKNDPPKPPPLAPTDSTEAKVKGKDKSSKKTSYPPVGIRVRPGKEGPPAVRQRVESGSPTRVHAPPFPVSIPPLPLSLPHTPVQPQPPTQLPAQPSRPQSVVHPGYQQRPPLLMPAPVQDGGMYHQPPQGHDASAYRAQSQPQSQDGHVQHAQHQQHQQHQQQEMATPNPSPNIDYGLPFGGGGSDDGPRMDVNMLTRRRFSIHDLGQGTAPSYTPQQGVYDQSGAGAYSAAPSPAFNSNGQLSSNAGSPFGASPSSSSPFGNSMPPPQQHPTPPVNYGASAPPSMNGSSSQNYYMPSAYETNYDSGAGTMNPSLVGLGMGMDNGAGSMPPPSVPGTPLYTIPPDKTMYDMKPPDAFGGGGEQQQQQQQGWMQNGSTGASEYWSNNNGYNNYPS